MSHFVAIKERGRWERGHWKVAAFVRCPHQHRTLDSALDCLMHNRPGDGVPVYRTWEEARRAATGNSFKSGSFGHMEVWPNEGRIVEVRVDGMELQARTVRPDRFVERRVTHGRVSGVWRFWKHELPVPSRPKYPVEIEITCGDWTESWIATAGTSADHVSGWVQGLHWLVDKLGADALVGWWQACQRPAPTVHAEEDDGVVVVGPWRPK